MKKIIFFTLVFLLVRCTELKQNDIVDIDSNNESIFYPFERNRTFKTCDTSRFLALENFKKGKYHRILRGFIVPDFDENDTISINDVFEREEFQFHYFLSKYNIEIVKGGCVSYPEESCYITTMDSLLGLKFGENYRSKIKQESDSVFNIFKRMPLVKRKEFINPQYLYTRISNEAYYMGDIDSLAFQVRNNILNDSLEFGKYRFSSLNLDLYIDQNGNIFDVDFDWSSQEIPNVTKQKIREYFQNAPAWIPGKLWGNPVKSIKRIEVSII